MLLSEYKIKDAFTIGISFRDILQFMGAQLLVQFLCFRHQAIATARTDVDDCVMNSRARARTSWRRWARDEQQSARARADVDDRVINSRSTSSTTRHTTYIHVHMCMSHDVWRSVVISAAARVSCRDLSTPLSVSSGSCCQTGSLLSAKSSTHRR